MAGFPAVACSTWHYWCAFFGVYHLYSAVSPRPGPRDWQSTVTISACCLSLLEQLCKLQQAVRYLSIVLWRYEILARRSISIRLWMKNRDFNSIRFFRVQYRQSTQFGTSHPKLAQWQYTATIENRQLYNLYSLSKWTIIVLFIYVNLEEKRTINLCLKSMSCLLLFTSRARHYVKNGFMSGFLNYASYRTYAMQIMCLLT